MLNILGIIKMFMVNSLVAGMILISFRAQALIIYDQPGSTLPGLRSAEVGFGRGIFDNFQLPTDFVLTRIEWTGGLVNPSSRGIPLIPPGVRFIGGIVSDVGGQPDGPPLAPSDMVANPTEVFLSSSSLPTLSTIVNRYSVDLSSPVILIGGQVYWLAINAQFLLPTDPSLEWHWAFGSGGDSHALVFTGSIPRTPVPSDFSFTLIGSPVSVPEPGGLVLVGIGFGALHFSRRFNYLKHLHRRRPR